MARAIITLAIRGARSMLLPRQKDGGHTQIPPLLIQPPVYICRGKGTQVLSGVRASQLRKIRPTEQSETAQRGVTGIASGTDCSLSLATAWLCGGGDKRPTAKG